jgi:hypothetical protein
MIGLAPQSERSERALSLLLWHSFALGVSESNRARTTKLRRSRPCFDEVREHGRREHGHHVSLLECRGSLLVTRPWMARLHPI